MLQKAATLEPRPSESSSLLHRMINFQRINLIKLQSQTPFPTTSFLFLRRQHQLTTENLPISAMFHLPQLFIYSPLHWISGSKTSISPEVLIMENILHKSKFWNGKCQKRIQQVLLLLSPGIIIILVFAEPRLWSPNMGSNSDPTPTSHVTLTLVKLLNLCTSVFS